MKTGTMSISDFLKGGFPQPKTGKGIHNFKAAWSDKGITIDGHKPSDLGVTFGATSDNRTCYAHLNGLGFIGGWQYPHRKMPFKYLVESINQGILYYDQNSLPKCGPKRR